MKRAEKWLPASEALVAHRVLLRISQQAYDAMRQGRDADGVALSRLCGQLEVRIFNMDENGRLLPMTTVFDAMRDDAEQAEEALKAEEEYRGPDVDAPYERMVEEEMGCE